MLLMLDSCEHVVEATAAPAQEFLKGTRALSCQSCPSNAAGQRPILPPIGSRDELSSIRSVGLRRHTTLTNQHLRMLRVLVGEVSNSHSTNAGDERGDLSSHLQPLTPSGEVDCSLDMDSSISFYVGGAKLSRNEVLE
jgi:hypothetical protein